MNVQRVTGPLSPPPPDFDTHTAPPDFAPTTPDPNLRDALLMLDVNADYCYSREMQLRELQFNFGYSEDEAKAVYKQWEQMQ